MAKKQSPPPPPNPHSPHMLSQNPNPNLMAKKLASPPPNPNLMAKKQPSPPPNPNLMAKKQPSPPPNPNLMARKQASPPNPNPNLMAKKQPRPPPNNPNLMAKKQLPPPSAPPSSSSEDEGSSSASNDEEAIIKKPNTQTPTNNQEKQEEETGYETDSESSDDEEGEEVNQPETKRPQPISTTAAIPALNKPCDHASKKPNGGKDNANNGDGEGESDSSSDEDEERRSHPKKPQAISMTAATPALKPRDGREKPSGKVNASGKFQRIWSLEDEIAILKAIAEFEVKHGPVKINLTGIGSFHDFVRDSLSLEVSDSQLYEKVRRLRRKYRHRANRGNTIKFRRAHDQKVYELSKKIWGAGSSGNAGAKKVAKSKRAATALGNDGAGSGSLKSKYPFLRDAMARSVSAELLEAVVDPENARLLEVTFKKQKVAEINYKKCEMKLMIEALDKVLEDIEKA